LLIPKKNIEKDYRRMNSIKEKTDNKILELTRIIDEKNEYILSLEKDNAAMKRLIDEYIKKYPVKKRKRFFLW